ncbi:hypothetical protein KAR91_41585 [Candidatus Pacearchaeota archaeon]|nr:hypothetical protein [Candidatus Pacearchaeota archaeon]
MIFKILSHSSDGTMNVLIDGKEYLYFLDAGYIKTVLKKAKKSGGGALNFLKNKARDCKEIYNDAEL